MSLTPVILAGGSGTRLWPLSRTEYPKQFLSVTGELSLLQVTARRVQSLTASAPVVVCAAGHRGPAESQLKAVGIDATYIVEPVQRNTAPAVALAAAFVLESGREDDTLLVMPSDHVIKDEVAFCDAVRMAHPHARDGRLVTFGITPSSPQTGFGYIHAGVPSAGVAPIEQFVEKPDLETATRFVASGDYLWNAGLFCFGARQFLQELAAHASEIHSRCERAYSRAAFHGNTVRVAGSDFQPCPSRSIDYAVMEPTQLASVIPVDIGWSDVGSWPAVQALGGADANENCTVGDVVTEQTSNCYVRSESRLVAALGVSGLTIVETPDAVLVASRDASQAVGDLAKKLGTDGRAESVNHTTVTRPWGHYESLISGSRFQVKRIRVEPGEQLSLQMHQHRAEHWIVVSGTAIVTRDEEEIRITENESVFIPLGAKHRLHNPGLIPLELIEVQTGSYLGEDDIVRFEDVYGRVEAAE